MIVDHVDLDSIIDDLQALSAQLRDLGFLYNVIALGVDDIVSDFEDLRDNVVPVLLSLVVRNSSQVATVTDIP